MHGSGRAYVLVPVVRYVRGLSAGSVSETRPNRTTHPAVPLEARVSCAVGGESESRSVALLPIGNGGVVEG